MESQSKELSLLIEELRAKALLTEEHSELISGELEERTLRIRLLALLDAWRDTSRLTTEDADRYIARLDFLPHEIDRLRSNQRERQRRKKSFN